MELSDYDINRQIKLRPDKYSQRLTNKYDNSVDVIGGATEEIINGHITDAQFINRLKKSGYGESKARDFLQKAKEEKANTPAGKIKKDESEYKKLINRPVTNFSTKAKKIISDYLGSKVSKIINKTGCTFKHIEPVFSKTEKIPIGYTIYFQDDAGYDMSISAILNRESYNYIWNRESYKDWNTGRINMQMLKDLKNYGFLAAIKKELNDSKETTEEVIRKIRKEAMIKESFFNY